MRELLAKIFLGDQDPEKVFLEKLKKLRTKNSLLLSESLEFLACFNAFETKPGDKYWKDLCKGLKKLHGDIEGIGASLYYFLKQHADREIWDMLYDAIVDKPAPQPLFRIMTPPPEAPATQQDEPKEVPVEAGGDAVKTDPYMSPVIITNDYSTRGIQTKGGKT